MGSMIALILFGVLLLIGLIGTVTGAVGLIVSLRRQKKGLLLSRTLPIVSAIFLAVGIGLMSTSAGLASVVVAVNATPPAGFVETETVIEEQGYQDTYFTADGVRYEVTGFYVLDDAVIGDAIFTYKVDGFLNKSKWGNYYKVHNTEDFPFVCDDYGLIFAPSEQRQRIVSYYTTFQNLSCYYYNGTDDEQQIPLTDEEKNDVRRFWNTELSDIKVLQQIPESPVEFWIELMSLDGTLYITALWFVELDGELCFVGEINPIDGDTYEYVLYELPERHATRLLAIHNAHK